MGKYSSVLFSIAIICVSACRKEEDPCAFFPDGRKVTDQSFLDRFDRLRRHELLAFSERELVLCEAPCLDALHNTLAVYAREIDNDQFGFVFIRSDLMNGMIINYVSGAEIVLSTDSYIDDFIVAHELAHAKLEHHLVDRNKEEDEADALALAVVGDESCRRWEAIKKNINLLFGYQYVIVDRCQKLHALARQRGWEK